MTVGGDLSLQKGNFRMGSRKQKSALRRATSAVKRLFTRSREPMFTFEAEPEQTRAEHAPQPPAERPIRRDTDIPLEVLNDAYTPPVTSSKASFRSDGSDHQLDQEFANGRADTRWRDEDRITNKSGDPRIGTHRRTYEPEEARAEEK